MGDLLYIDLIENLENAEHAGDVEWFQKRVDLFGLTDKNFKKCTV